MASAITDNTSVTLVREIRKLDGCGVPMHVGLCFDKYMRAPRGADYRLRPFVEVSSQQTPSRPDE